MDSADFKCHSRICKDSESLFLRSQSYPFSVSEQQLHAKVVMMLVLLFKSPMFRLKNHLLSLANSVTRLGDILLLRRLFKACGNDYYARIAHVIGRFLKKCPFSRESIFGQLFIDNRRLLTQAFWSPCLPTSCQIEN